MLEIDLVGAEVLGPDGVHDDALSLAQGHICAERTGRQIDLTGYRVLPGIIDVHGDGFERHMAPRRGAMKQPAEGLFAVEAELAANGITTGVLAQFVSWEGGLRSLEFADQVFCALRDTKSDLVTDLRPQLRFEVSLLELYDGLPAQIAEWNVGYVVFNDHLPHDRLAEGRKPPRLTGQALKAGRNPDAHFQMLLDLHAKVGQAQAALGPLCAQLAKAGVRMGSHDDNTADGHNTWQARGIRVAEFPETQDAAEAAKAAGSTVVLGAPNLVRGGSHSGNVAASELAQFDLLDVLSSDYVPASLLMGALLLADQWDDMARGMATVTSAPAQHAGLTDRGTLREGQRADLVRFGRMGRAPLVRGVWSAGNQVA